MSRRRAHPITQLLAIVAVAVVAYLLLRSVLGGVAGYAATGFAGVLVGLYLPIWTQRAGRYVRTRTSWWGWWW